MDNVSLIVVPCTPPVPRLLGHSRHQCTDTACLSGPKFLPSLDEALPLRGSDVFMPGAWSADLNKLRRHCWYILPWHNKFALVCMDWLHLCGVLVLY